MPLNEYQRSSLQVSLKLLEKMLMEIEVLLNLETEGTLYRRILDIHTDRRSQILAISQDARREIAELATIFDLKREEIPVHQIIVAKWRNAMRKSTTDPSTQSSGPAGNNSNSSVKLHIHASPRDVFIVHSRYVFSATASLCSMSRAR